MFYILSFEMNLLQNYIVICNAYFRDDRINRDSVVDGSNNSDSGFSSPVPCKHQPENIVLDDSSEDSFHSSASENGRSIK